MTGAIISGEIHETRIVMFMMASARMRCSTKPLTRVLRRPVIGVGMKQRAASKTESSCTFWKKKLMICPKPLKVPQMIKSLIQIEEKDLFLHSELGMSVGLPRLVFLPNDKAQE